MSSFNLSQALEGSPEFPAFNDKGFDMTDVQEQIFRLDEGLDLVVSHYPRTMQNTATLLIAMNRMKKPLTHCVRKLCSRELCSALIDNLVEETIEETKINFCSKPRRLFRRLSSIEQCNLCDLSQKNIVFEPGTLELQAIILKAGDLRCKVKFLLQKYSLQSPRQDQPGQPILLSIPNRSGYISCSKKDDGAVLQLEYDIPCTDLDRIYDDKPESRFLFYRRSTGNSMNTFESVSCPGWYISIDEEKMEMCQQDSKHPTVFKVNEV